MDLRRRNPPMPQRPLHQIQVPSPPAQPRRKRVPQGVYRESPGDACLAQPPGEVELDLPGAEATAGLGAEKGRVRASGSRERRSGFCGFYGLQGSHGPSPPAKR